MNDTELEPVPSPSKPTEAVHEVEPARLAAGWWDETSGQEVGKGDIYAAYSADTIAMQGVVRPPFRFRNAAWTTVSLAGPDRQATAYRLVPERAFKGRTFTYREKVRRGGDQAARSDPSGFYHGMRVRWCGETHVLAGPPEIFLPGAPSPVQGELFPAS